MARAVEGLGGRDGRHHLGRQPVPAADHGQAHVVLPQRPGLVSQEPLEEPHEDLDLLRGPGPVVGGEGEETQGSDPGVGRRLDDPADRVDARVVSGRAGEPAAERPPPIAIHDDGDMNPVRIHS